MGLSYTDSHIQTLYSVTNVSTHAIPCFHLCSMPGIGTIFSGTQAVATTRARPGRCPLAGPASRASGPAPTWRRWSGRATDRAGVGRRASPGGRWGGGRGEGVGELRRCLGGRRGLEACEWGDGGVAGVSGLRSSRRRGRGRWQHPRERALASSLSVRFLRQARHGLRPTLAAFRHRHPPEAVNPP